MICTLPNWPVMYAVCCFRWRKLKGPVPGVFGRQLVPRRQHPALHPLRLWLQQPRRGLVRPSMHSSQRLPRWYGIPRQTRRCCHCLYRQRRLRLQSRIRVSYRLRNMPDLCGRNLFPGRQHGGVRPVSRRDDKHGRCEELAGLLGPIGKALNHRCRPGTCYHEQRAKVAKE
jgi:hypothetical protein